MQVQTFLPKYPSINTTDDLFRMYNDESFNQVIFSKKEFYDLKLTRNEEELPDNTLYNHQKIIARFLASYTLYDELFLFHSPGTGKTCSAIGAIEQVVQQSNQYNIKRALILVKNTGLVKQFHNEILFTCTNNKYVPDDVSRDQVKFSKTPAQLVYNVMTYEKFYNRFVNDRNGLINNFSNAFIVIDEIHDLLHSRMYSFIYDFLHSITNRKILLMTGTPMMNDASDIALLMNLILPEELVLPTGSEFDARYIDSESGRLKEDTQVELENVCRGRVSYLRSRIDIQYEFQGTRIDSTLAFPLSVNIMSSHQTNYYRLAYQADSDREVGSGFYNQSLEASLFVFPGGEYGSTGYQNYIKETRNWFSAPFLRSLSGKSTEEKLQSISVWSSKYANVIRTIINNPDQNVFVYMKSITGSGAIVFGMCLELFGYRHTRGGGSTPAKRYAILSGKTETEWNTIRKSFNRASNKDGKYIQVLIGGEQIKQGVTFWSIQQIHIVTPEWNYSNIDQAIARGIRMRAHRYLNNKIVRVFLHVSVEQQDINTIDVDVYRIAQRKDISIKNIERLIKQSAFDCALTYERNKIVNGQDNTRECDYTDCLYRCKGVDTPYIISDKELNRDTYQLFFTNYYIDTIINVLKDVFVKQHTISLWQLVDYFTQSNMIQLTQFQLVQAIQQIIDRRVQLRNRYGLMSFLHEENNILFLTSGYTLTSYYDSFYNEHPVLHDETTFSSAIDESIRQVVEVETSIIAQLDNPIERIYTLPKEYRLAFLRTAVLYPNTPLSSQLLETYSSIVNLADKSIRVSETMVQQFDGTEWVYESVVQGMDIDELVRLPPFVFGMYKGRKQLFSIVDMRELSNEPVEVRISEFSKRGRTASTLKIPDLVDLLLLFNVVRPDSVDIDIDTAETTMQRKKIDYDTMTDEQKLNIGYWLSQKKKIISTALEDKMLADKRVANL